MLRCRIAQRLVAPALCLATIIAATALAEPGSLQFTKKGHVSCGDILNAPEGTIEFWFKPATNENNEWVISKTGDANNSMDFGFGPAALMFMVKNAGQVAYAYVNKTDISADAWHHIACTFTGNKAVLFVDGVGYPRNSTPGDYSLAHLKGGEFRIGRGTAAYPERFNGLVAEVRLSDTVRYAEDFTPSTTPPAADEHTVALWHFAEGQGTSVRDSGPGKHDGKMVETVTWSKERPKIAEEKSLLKKEAAGSGTLPCVRLAKAPAIDGDLNDPCWTEAAACAGFLDLAGAGYVLAPKQTTVKLAYDDKALYLAAVCLEPDMAHLIAQVKDRDGPVYNDDCLELFLDPKRDGTSHCQFVFNSLGNYFDASWNGENIDIGWNARATTAAQRLNDRWLLEAAIPFAELKIEPPKEGATWGLNIGREHRVNDNPSFSIWAPAERFNEPQRFGALQFAASTLGKLPREVSNLRFGIRNPAFVQKDDKGVPIGWQLGGKTAVRETAYLSAEFYLVTDADELMARQQVNCFNVAGREYEFSVRARGEGDARLGLEVVYETHAGTEGRIRAFWDQPLTGDYALYSRVVKFPQDVLRITSVELHRSNQKGTLQCREIDAADNARGFAEVKDANELLEEHRRGIGEPFVSPSIAWAKPLAGGPVKALCIVAQGRSRREVAELAQRLDMAVDMCWITANGVCVGYGGKAINASLRREGKPYDVILLATPVKNRLLAQVIKENVAAGTGLVYLRNERDTERMPWLDALLPKMKKWNEEDTGLTRGIPLAHLPLIPPGGSLYSGFTGVPCVEGIGSGKHGEGAIVALTYGNEGTLRGLLPKPYFNPSPLDRWWEYAYALLGRSMLLAAGRTPSVKIASAEMDPKGVLRASLEGQGAFQGTVTIEFKDKFGAVQSPASQEKVSLPAAGKAALEVKFPTPLLQLNGVALAHLSLRDAEGEVVDWTTAALPVKGDITLADAYPFPRDWYKEGQRIEGSLSVENRGAGRAAVSLTTELLDCFNRSVWSEKRDLSVEPRNKAQALVAPSLDRTLTVYHRLRATVSNDKGPLEIREWELNLPYKWKNVMDDFHSGLNADYIGHTHTDEAFARWTQGMGFTFGDEGGLFPAGPRLNIPWERWITAQEFFQYRGMEKERTPCLNDPKTIQAAIAQARDSIAATEKYAPAFYRTGDELELARDGRVEVCFCPICADAFRKWAGSRHTTLDKANSEWGTQFRKWDEVQPITVQEARKRGNFAQWVDFRTFMDDTFASAFVAVKKGVKEAYPDVPYAFSNPFELNPFSGTDLSKTIPAEDVVSKYMTQHLVKEGRSFNPTALMHSFYGYTEDVPSCAFFPWWFALNGGDAMTWWVGLRDDVYDLVDCSGRPTLRSQAVVKAHADLITGIGKILHDTPPARSQVAVLYSQSSMHVSWIESDMQLGQVPWADHAMDTLPVSNPFAQRNASLENFRCMLKETSQQPEMVTPDHILQGKLEGRRMLILPYSIALSDDVAAKIAEFVKNGGTVVADVRTGAYTEHGRFLGARPAVESLFGIRRTTEGYSAEATSIVNGSELAGIPPTAGRDQLVGKERIQLTTGRALAKHADGTPAFVVNDMGKGKAIFLNFLPGMGPSANATMGKMLDLAGVNRPVTLARDGGQATGHECFLFENGPVRYLGVLRDMPPPTKGTRPVWFSQAFRQASAEKEALTVQFAAPYHVYDVRTGKYRGQVQTVQAELDPAEALFLALLPYRVTGVTVAGVENEYRPGDRLHYRAAVAVSEGTPGDHALRIAVADPDGAAVAHYTCNVMAKAGAYDGEFPLALNEKAGTWTLTVTDVTSKAAQSVSFKVAADAAR